MKHLEEHMVLTPVQSNMGTVPVSTGTKTYSRKMEFTYFPLCLLVLHPQMQPVVDQEYSRGKHCICAEHVQTFSCHHCLNHIV
jgi:hypothetical protein